MTTPTRAPGVGIPPPATTLYVESTPSVIYSSPQCGMMNALVGLRDGSFVACSSDFTVTRWVISTDSGSGNKTLELVGTYIGHLYEVWCALEMDDNTLITGGNDERVNVWNIATCECLKSVNFTAGIRHLLSTKKGDTSHVMCDLEDWSVEIRNTSDWSLIFRFDHHQHFFTRRLRDRTFLSGCHDNSVIIWHEDGTVLSKFDGHSEFVTNVIELRTDLIVSTSADYTLKLWKESTGECLHTSSIHSVPAYGLEPISQNKFVSGLADGTIVVWDDNGCCLEWLQTKSSIEMTKVGNALVIVGHEAIEIIQLK